MKKYKKLFYILAVASVGGTGCTKQPYFDIPTDANGNITITTVSSTKTNGVTVLDGSFTVTATLPNATSGDVFNVELLKLQPLSPGEAEQLLPMQGTLKQVTVGADLQATITYTREEANLDNIGDYVTVTFSGKTESATVRLDLKSATTVSNTQYNGNDIEVIRGAGSVNIKVDVATASETYNGDVVVKRKNGINEPWQNVGTFSAPASVPVNGSDFAASKDTMYYSFVTAKGNYSEEIIREIIVSDGHFFARKNASNIVSDPAKAGLNIFTGENVAADSPVAHWVMNSDLSFSAGLNWATAGKSLQFVPATAEMYNNNDAQSAITLFNAGTPANVVNPVDNDGVYVFKLVNGIAPDATWYGIIKFNQINLGQGIDYEYRIAHLYSQRALLP